MNRGRLIDYSGRALEDEKLRIEMQTNYELLYKFYSDEIKHFKLLPEIYYHTLISDPEDSDHLSKDFKMVIRTSMEYFDMMNFFLNKLLKAQISNENKEVLIKLYHISYRKFKYNIKIPATDTIYFDFIQEHAKFFANTYLRNIELMKELEIHRKSLRNRKY